VDLGANSWVCSVTAWARNRTRRKIACSGERQLRKLTFMESFVELQAGVTSLNTTFITQKNGKLNETITSLSTEQLHKKRF